MVASRSNTARPWHLALAASRSPLYGELTGQVCIVSDVLIVANGFPEDSGYPVDYIEAVAEVEPKVPLRLLHLKLEQFVILVVQSFVYRELTRQVIIVAVTSRPCQVYPDAYFANAMRGYVEDTAVLSDNILPTPE